MTGKNPKSSDWRRNCPTLFDALYTGRYLYLHPTHELSGQVFPISDSGVSYKLIVATGADPFDTSVRITATGTQTRQRLLATRTLTAVNLIRAMVRQELLPGVEHAEARQEEVYNDGTLSLRVLEAYVTPTMRGYVLHVENLTNVSVPVPLQNIEMPGLLAIGARSQILYRNRATIGVVDRAKWERAVRHAYQAGSGVVTNNNEGHTVSAQISEATAVQKPHREPWRTSALRRERRY